MFLLTALTELGKTSATEKYDKLGLLSTSYSFLWENSSHNDANNLHNKTKFNSTYAYSFKFYDKAKYKSFLIILLNATKHKIGKKLHNQNKVVQNIDSSFVKETNSSPVDNHIKPTENDTHTDKQQKSRKKFKEFQWSLSTKDENTESNFETLDLSTSSSARIIQRKYIKYRKWKDKNKANYETYNHRHNLKKLAYSLNNMLKSENISNESISSYSFKETKINELASLNVHRQFIFGQIADDGQWESFEFLLRTGISINSVQKKINTNKDLDNFSTSVLTTETYLSVTDLFLRNVPSEQPSTLTSVVTVFTCLPKYSHKPGIYPKILASLLQKGADIRIIDNTELYPITGGIQSDTISHTLQNAAIQLNNILHHYSMGTNDEIVDNAGLLRQLLNAGMIPPKVFFLKHTDKLFFHIGESIHRHYHHQHHYQEMRNTDGVVKNVFYPLLIYELVKWNFYDRCSEHSLPPVLQSFTVLFLNFVYSGLCILPTNAVDILDMNSFTRYLGISCYHNEYTSFNTLEHERFLSHFSFYHNKFSQLINRQPIRLFIQCRYVVRSLLGTRYFHEKLMTTTVVDEDDEQLPSGVQESNKEFVRQLQKIPEQLRRDIGYIEAINLKNELYFLTGT
uniref:Uncharacterized protein n=1 Tax=Trichobilharzia regenti TaxID=157069 RepID=A0AA85KL83_TRIRE|nr:unnamed protein product [Trichobilharzia regenti]